MYASVFGIGLTVQ